MRIYIWHGYLLRGTGSNEYTQALARTLARQGHDVTVFCQDDGSDLDLAGAAVRRPAVPGRLPVFVLDAYQGMDPALLGDFAADEIAAYVAAQAAAVRAEGPADLLIANHVLLGSPVAAAAGLPFVVKAHGSELEYAMRGDATLCAWAADSLAAAAAVVAGSEHIRSVVQELVGFPADRIAVIPPGVDTAAMRPRPRGDALAGLIAESRVDPPNPPDAHDERAPDGGNADRLAAFFAEGDPVVTYVGKLSREKGVALLIDALADLPARAVIVGFGPEREALEEQAQRLGVAALFTGPLQHRHLRQLWPLAVASTAPSVFPEAFGMVAAEAAACGCPPVVARHSGLAEVAAGLDRFLPDQLRLTSFASGDAASLHARLAAILGLSDTERQTLQDGCRAAAEALWSWDSVARRIVAAAQDKPV